MSYTNEGFTSDGEKKISVKEVSSLEVNDAEIQDKEWAGTVPLTPGEKWRILRNVVVLSLAFMVHFTAFQGAVNLQSTINIEDGLGTASLASIYASLIFSNLFLPVVMINLLGVKWATAVSFIAYMPYIGAQFYPTFYTMIPAGILVGLGGGPLWVSKCTYLTVVATPYQKLTGILSEVLVVRFFGIFFMIFQFSQVWGNLISSLVLTKLSENINCCVRLWEDFVEERPSGEPRVHPLMKKELTFMKHPWGRKVLTSGNSTGNVTVDLSTCGANFIAKESEGLNDQPPEKIRIIAIIYLACMACACIIVAIGVDPLTRYEKKRQGSGTGLSGFQLLAITMKLLKERNQLLLLVITAWLGLGQAFVGADYTAAYVACAWGTGNIGYVMICYGLLNSISAIGAGSLVKITGRLPVVVGASILQIGIIIALLLWEPNPEYKPLFFVFSGLWGVCDGVWLVQINALCGILFPAREEAAYSNFRLWESLGFIIAYVYSPYLRTYVKLYILLGVLVVGMVFYVVIELGEKKRLKKIKNGKNSED